MPPTARRHPVLKQFLLLTAVVLLILPASLCAQGFGSATGLLQGEHLARSTLLLQDTLKATSDTTAWLPFGTHRAVLAGERPFAPTRFTLFVKLDTANVNYAAAPRVALAAEVALNDTATAYVQQDGSLTLAPSTAPVTEVAHGVILPVPVYGGGWVRFIATAEDSVAIRVDLWRTR